MSVDKIFENFQQSLQQVKLKEDQVSEVASTLVLVRVGLIVKGSSLVGKIVDLVLDKTLPLWRHAKQIHEALLPKEKMQDLVFQYTLGSDTKHLNASLNLQFYEFDETKAMLTVSPILTFEKTALSEDYRMLSLSATYTRPVNWRPFKKSKLMPGVALLYQCGLYLFKPQEDGAQLTALRVVALDYAVVFPETEDYIRVERIGTKTRDTDDAETKKDTFLYPKGRQEYQAWYMMLSAQCRNTIETKVIGIPLSVLFKRSAGNVPDVLLCAIKFLDQPDFLQEEGIFRKSGGAKDIEAYMTRIDAGEPVDYSDCIDIHNVTGIIKRWLGLLPVPLLSPYQKFMEIDDRTLDDADDLFARVYEIVKVLPREHLLTTIALMKFLAKVATHSQTNLMTAKNLALVVGPNVIRPAEQSFAGVAEQQLSNTPKVTTIVTMLIEKWALLESRLQEAKLLPAALVVPQNKLDLNKEIRERKIQMKRRAEKEGSPSSTAKTTSLKAAIGDLKRDSDDLDSNLSPLQSPRRVNYVAERDREKERAEKTNERERDRDRDRDRVADRDRSNTLEALLSPRNDREPVPHGPLGLSAIVSPRSVDSITSNHGGLPLVSPRRRPTAERMKRNMQAERNDIEERPDSGEEIPLGRGGSDLAEQIRKATTSTPDRERSEARREEVRDRENRQDMLRKKASASELNRKESDIMLRKESESMLRKPLNPSHDRTGLSNSREQERERDDSFGGLKKALRPAYNEDNSAASLPSSTQSGPPSLAGSAQGKALPAKLTVSEQTVIGNMKRTIELLIDKVESMERNLEAQVERNRHLEEVVRDQGRTLLALQHFQHLYQGKLAAQFGMNGPNDRTGLGGYTGSLLDATPLSTSQGSPTSLSMYPSMGSVDEANAFIEELYREDPTFTNDSRGPLSPRRITPRLQVKERGKK